MKRNKQLIMGIICLLTVLLAVMSLTGCAHKHAYEASWSFDSESHWHACTGEDCSKIAGKSEHSWNSEHQCTVCSYQGEHTKENLVAKAPTCTEAGLTEGSKCSVCGKILVAQETVGALGHTEAADAAVAPDCTNVGYTEGKHCSVCNTVLVAQEPIDALGHDYGELTYSWNEDHSACTAVRVCNRDATHVEGQYAVITSQITQNRSCTDDELTTYTAQFTGTAFSATTKTTVKTADKLGHTEVTDAALAPDCTNTGLTEGKHCSVCNTVLVAQNTVEALGHSYGSLVAKNDATCLQTGMETYYFCNACNTYFTSEKSETAVEALTIAIDANNHASSAVSYINLGDKGHSVNHPCCGAVITALVAHDMRDGKCISCGYAGYVRVDAQGNTDADGEYILFGTYPQTKVTDTAVLASLAENQGSLPTAESAESWISYGYYMGTGSTFSASNETPFMWYKDVSLDGELYRGVYFTSLRPGYTYQVSPSQNNQTRSGYAAGNVYWFKFEPVKWRILSDENGEALLLCEMIIDAQTYYDLSRTRTDSDGNIIYENNYAESHIRAWLNDTFYKTAFGELQKNLILKTTVDNSAATTESNPNDRACIDTEDNIFLLSFADTVNTDYGFNSDQYNRDDNCIKQTTDYAQSQNAYAKNFNGDYSGKWWTRSPINTASFSVSYVNTAGSVGDRIDANVTSIGVAPAVYIQLQ